MSSVHPGENPGRRKPKVSHATFVDVGLVGPKLRPIGVGDGQQVDIPVHDMVRYQLRMDKEGSLSAASKMLSSK